MPFTKGDKNINRSGRPKGSLESISLTKLVQEQLAKRPEGERLNYAQSIVSKLIDKAREGDIRAITMIFNYLEGTPKQMSTPVNEASLSLAERMLLSKKEQETEKTESTMSLEEILSIIPDEKLRAKVKYRYLKALYPDRVPDDV